MDVNYNSEGVVFDIQRFSIHDGPGIRTILFLKGCPLSCKWCSNPESQLIRPVIMYQEDRCIRCKDCIHICPEKALDFNIPGLVDRKKCVGCGECENICPTGALTLKGKKMTVQQVIKELAKDASNYRHSGGGVTLSGGEPLVQWEFAREVLKACKYKGWHTAMETTAYTNDEKIIDEIFPLVDLVLMDCKSCDDAIHRKYTGVSNRTILKNAQRITQIAKTVIRIPTIPGVNATEAAFDTICAFAKSLTGIDTIHILPYHTYGENKYGLLGREYEMKDTNALTTDTIRSLQRVVEKNGFKCVIGG